MIIIESGENLEVLTDAIATTTEPSWRVGVVAAVGSSYTQATSEAGVTTGTTAVIMIAGVASTQKRVMGLSVFNRDTVNRIITIRASATLQIIKATIVPGGSLQYDAGYGWSVHDANGVMQYVGATGAAGINGALTVSSAEINVGALPTIEAVIVVTDASVTATSKIIAVHSGIAATGKDADEAEMDVIILRCTPNGGSFTVYVLSLTGPVSGLFKINYQFSN